MTKNLKTIKAAETCRQRTKLIVFLLLIVSLLGSNILSVCAATADIVPSGVDYWDETKNGRDAIYAIDSEGYYNESERSSHQKEDKEVWARMAEVVREYNQHAWAASNIRENVKDMLDYMLSANSNKYNNSNKKAAKILISDWAVDVLQPLLNLDIRVRAVANKKWSGNGSTVTDKDRNEVIKDINAAQKSMNALVKKIRKAYDNADYVASSYAANRANKMFSLFNKLWKSLGSNIKTMGTGSGKSSFLGITFTTKNMKYIANTLSAITKGFAYALACVLFGINLTTTAIQYELLTVRGMCRVFGRVLLAKLWIDLAINICCYTLDIVNSLARQILKVMNTKGSIIGFKDTLQVANEVDDDWWDFIGALVNWFSQILWSLPLMIIGIVLCIMVCLVFLKLIARSFELTCLITLSPIAFATLVGEETKHYFKKFFQAFISTARYIVYVAIVYAVGTSWIADMNDSAATSFVALMFETVPRALVVCAVCNLMRKPPRVLTSLVE